jgi:peptide/nickel transport system permease protein
MSEDVVPSTRWAVWRRPDAVVPTAEAGEADTGGYRGGAFRQFTRRYLGQWIAVAALAVIVLIAVMAIFAPLFANHEPDLQTLGDANSGPSRAYWLGTDHLGRDIYSRLIYAARVSLPAALEATGIAVVIGVPLGLLAGYFRGRVDGGISLVTDAIMALPPLILALALLGALGQGLSKAMLAVGIVFAPRFLRLVRGTVLSIREETYIEASVAAGTPTRNVLIRHVLPNALPPLLVQGAFTLGFAMLAEASLSFLGLGVQPPTSSWGSMLSEAFDNINRSRWAVVPPGVTIAVAVLAFNLIGDGLREAVGRERRTG